MMDSIVQLITVLVIFIFVLVLAYFTAHLTARVQKGKLKGSNIEVLETIKIAQNKYIQIVRVGEKYFSYIVCKDTVTLLGELDKNEIPDVESAKSEPALNINFKEVFDRLKKG
jgi:flagellar protein FliO/FliZ